MPLLVKLAVLWVQRRRKNITEVVLQRGEINLSRTAGNKFLHSTGAPWGNSSASVQPSQEGLNGYIQIRVRRATRRALKK